MIYIVAILVVVVGFGCKFLERRWPRERAAARRIDEKAEGFRRAARQWRRELDERLDESRREHKSP